MGAVRASLDAAQLRWRPAERDGEELSNVTDVDIGVDAYSACSAHAEAGFSFEWHEDQHPLSRRSTRLGVDVPG